MLNQTVSHYTILTRIGEGGMGVVYKAQDNALRRTVALKVLPEGSRDDEELQRRFLREARAASALNHPGIVTIHEVVSEGGSTVLVMELVEGTPLSELIEPGGMALERACSIVHQIADAVAAAHAAGIVHRDLKPANVIVMEGDRVKVLDFGLAKRSLAGGADGPTAPTHTAGEALTRHGAVIGTLHYMSPEQALGRPADARSDVFSLGVIFYELVTGERPFQGDSAPSLLHHVAYTDPRPAPQLRQGLPAAVAGTIRRALAKEPDKRFETMASFAQAVKPTLPAAPRSRLDLFWKACAALVVLAVVLLAVPQTRSLLGDWLSSGFPSGVALTERDPATLEQRQLLELGRLLLARYDRPKNVDRAIEAFQLAIAKDPEFAPAYAGIGRARWRKYRLEKDPTLLEAARASAERAIELDPLFVDARVALALVQVASGDHDEARSNLEAVLLVDPANPDAHRGLGDLAVAGGELAAAEDRYQEALEGRPDDWELLLLVAYAQLRQAKYAEAEEPSRRAVEVAPDNASAHRNLAAALHYQGRYAEAATVLQKALELQPRADVYTNLGTLYFFQGLYEQSIASFERARELDSNHHRTWANLADAYRWTAGREEEATETYRRAIQLVRERIDKKPDDGRLVSNLALYLAKSGKPDEAINRLDQLGGLDQQSTDTLYRAAVVFELAGLRERALEILEGALERGYSRTEIEHDPELAELRADVRYHQMLLRLDPES